jgi:hypothetical protein
MSVPTPDAAAAMTDERFAELRLIAKRRPLHTREPEELFREVDRLRVALAGAEADRKVGAAIRAALATPRLDEHLTSELRTLAAALATHSEDGR